MAKVEIYATAVCPYCVMAKKLLERKSVAYQEIRVDLDTDKRQEMIKRSRQRTVPQIIINNEAIGGYTDLVALNNSQQLDRLLAQS